MSTSESPSSPEGPYESGQIDKLVALLAEFGHPKQIGPFRVLGVIGEGGMGTVFKAEQLEPLQRIVAIKLIKVGMDTREVLERFQAERQTLARLEHPNIARVIDAGTTELGRPYFVMEFVEGEPITAFADRHKLRIEQRLELFTQACHGVQHAHQKAIIHRDLKPANILVTRQDGRPLVKIIDFGISKVLDQERIARTAFTEAGRLVGTLEYMSPEQADLREQDIDTRTDVYSLGVVLYELLTATVPFDSRMLRIAGYAEIQRIIREVDPPRPSTRLSELREHAGSVAAERRTEIQQLESQFDRELDWIPLMALRKDRATRYTTVQQFADDVANYLARRPLIAGPDSASYRVRKFVRRHRAGVSLTAAALLLLASGIAATTWQAVRATRAERQAHAEQLETDRQRQRAEQVSQDLKEVNRFVTEDMLASASPGVTRGRTLTVLEAVDRAAATVGRRFAGRPGPEASVEAALADTYDAIGITERALPHATRARELCELVYGADHELTLSAWSRVGEELCHLNRHAEAEPLLRDASEHAVKRLGENHAVTLSIQSNLAMAIRMQNRLDEAEKIYRHVLDGQRATRGPESIEASKAMNNLAVNLGSQGRPHEAVPLYREALEIQRKQFGDDHPAYLGGLANLSKALQQEGKVQEAEYTGKLALAQMRRVLKDDHPSTMLAMNDVAYLLVEEGKLVEGESLYREALERRQRVLGADDPDTLQTLQNLGYVLTLQKRYAEAEPLQRMVMEKRRQILGPDAFGSINSTSGLATLLFKQGKYAECDPLIEAVCSAKEFSVYTPAEQAMLVTRCGVVLEKIGKVAAAEPVLLDARERLLDSAPVQKAPLSDVLRSLLAIYQQTNRPADAERCRDELKALESPSTRPSQPVR